MKNLVFVIIFLKSSYFALSQENIVTLSSGYAFCNIEDVEIDASGWRINGLYEFNPNAQNFTHGLSFGYIGTKATYTNALGNSTDYELNTFPLYYAPKFLFGTNTFKGFIKGALGMHISNYHRTGDLGDLKVSDSGLYAGAGLGVNYYINEMIFITAEYEWAYLSNGWYKDGFMNTISGGIGIKF